MVHVPTGGCAGSHPTDRAAARVARAGRLRLAQPERGATRPKGVAARAGPREEIEMRVPMFGVFPRGCADGDEDKLLTAMDLSWWGGMHADGSARLDPDRGERGADDRREWVSPTSSAREE